MSPDGDDEPYRCGVPGGGASGGEISESDGSVAGLPNKRVARGDAAGGDPGGASSLGLSGAESGEALGMAAGLGDGAASWDAGV